MALDHGFQVGFSRFQYKANQLRWISIAFHSKFYKTVRTPPRTEQQDAGIKKLFSGFENSVTSSIARFSTSDWLISCIVPLPKYMFEKQQEPSILVFYFITFLSFKNQYPETKTPYSILCTTSSQLFHYPLFSTQHWREKMKQSTNLKRNLLFHVQ